MRRSRLGAFVLLIWPLAAIAPEPSAAQRRSPSRQTQQEKSKIPLTDNWFGIASPDGDYTAEFPSEPKYRKTGPDQRGQTYHNYQLYSSKCRCNFEITSYKLNLSPDKQARFDEVEQNKGSEQIVLKSQLNQGWRLLGRRDLQGNGYQHLFMVPGDRLSKPTTYVRAMSFNHGFYVYTLIFTGPTREALFGPEARRFFDSFKFTGRR